MIGEDPSLELLARDVPMAEIEAAVARHQPDVVLFNFGTLSAPADVLRLHQEFPDTRVVVLAHRPTAAECNQMLEFGATGCLSKETEARDIVSAIHLARAACTCCRARPRRAGASSGWASGARIS